MHPTGKPIRDLMMELCTTPKKVTVFLSSGVDSNSILHALILNGHTPTVTSFCMDGKVSSDFRAAQRIAMKLGLDFYPVFLPTDLDVLVDDIKTMMRDFLVRKKTEIESFWPCWYAIKASHENGQRVIANGLTAGGLFGDDRECSIRGHGPEGDDPSWLDQIRAEKFSKPNYGQKLAWALACGERQIQIISPFRDERFREILHGVSYKSCNTPKQKQPLRSAFPEMFGIKDHTNLQLGDSGISEHFKKLLKHPVNVNNNLSVVGIYNRLGKEIENEG